MTECVAAMKNWKIGANNAILVTTTENETVRAVATTMGRDPPSAPLSIYYYGIGFRPRATIPRMVTSPRCGGLVTIAALARV